MSGIRGATGRFNGVLATRFQNSVHQTVGITIVEAERELIEIEREILLGDFMKDPHDPALDQ